VGRSGPEGKPFQIPEQLVWEAYGRVKANKGAAGVDGESIAGFESDLRGNLYKIWNRMSSGTYFPPPVMAVEIPKSGGGTRTLGVPTVADRVAQTVAAMALEARTESIFHEDSYGYRPRRGALDAVGSVSQDPAASWGLVLGGSRIRVELGSGEELVHDFGAGGDDGA
jgi:RNA-directed DNA polymerase